MSDDGLILAAHCNCMAGLGEACSHVAAVLFFVEAAIKLRDAKTVTQAAAYWLLPGAMTNTGYYTVQETDFQSRQSMKQNHRHFLRPRTTRNIGKFSRTCREVCSDLRWRQIVANSYGRTLRRTMHRDANRATARTLCEPLRWHHYHRRPEQEHREDYACSVCEQGVASVSRRSIDSIPNEGGMLHSARTSFTESSEDHLLSAYHQLFNSRSTVGM